MAKRGDIHSKKEFVVLTMIMSYYMLSAEARAHTVSVCSVKWSEV